MLNINNVYHGDCLDIMKEIEDKSIDLIITDLPYQITKSYFDIIIPFESLWEYYKRIIKDKSAIVLFSSQPFTSKLVCSNLNMFKYEWIWEKSTKTNFLNAKKQPLRKHENIIVFGGKNIRYFPQGIKEKNSFTRQGKTETQNYDKIDRTKGGYFQENSNYPHDILKFTSENTSNILHPTQKPVALYEYLIKTYTNEGDTVLDSCAGSGTCGIACLNTNRNYILIEKEQKYFDVINKRIDEHKNKLKNTLQPLF